METTQKRHPKTKMTIHLSADAVDVLRFAGYCSDRTVGVFVSDLIMEHHARVQRAKTDAPPTPVEMAAELRRLADLLEVDPMVYAPRAIGAG
jgi:hypothetical protein